MLARPPEINTLATGPREFAWVDIYPCQCGFGLLVTISEGHQHLVPVEPLPGALDQAWPYFPLPLDLWDM